MADPNNLYIFTIWQLVAHIEVFHSIFVVILVYCIFIRLRPFPTNFFLISTARKSMSIVLEWGFQGWLLGFVILQPVFFIIRRFAAKIFISLFGLWWLFFGYPTGTWVSNKVNIFALYCRNLCSLRKVQLHQIWVAWWILWYLLCLWVIFYILQVLIFLFVIWSGLDWVRGRSCDLWRYFWGCRRVSTGSSNGQIFITGFFIIFCWLVLFSAGIFDNHFSLRLCRSGCLIFDPFFTPIFSEFEVPVFSTRYFVVFHEVFYRFVHQKGCYLWSLAEIPWHF